MSHHTRMGNDIKGSSWAAQESSLWTTPWGASYHSTRWTGQDTDYPGPRVTACTCKDKAHPVPQQHDTWNWAAAAGALSPPSAAVPVPARSNVSCSASRATYCPHPKGKASRAALCPNHTSTASRAAGNYNPADTAICTATARGAEMAATTATAACPSTHSYSHRHTTSGCRATAYIPWPSTHSLWL